MRPAVALSFIAAALFLTACHEIKGSTEDTTATANAALNPLNSDQKYALAFMWHEEKLAHDLYLALNRVNPAYQFTNIANKSESTHIALVEELVKSYDINITNFDHNYSVSYSEEELREIPPGTFAIQEIQERYDTLYAQGVPSLAASLETGCIVEVTDVDDLNHYIGIAGDHEDLVDTFMTLRAESYNHYWAFSKGLVDLGVTDGCCSLGDPYCKTAQEYPPTMMH